MLVHLKKSLVGCSALVALAAGTARAADVTISDAKIAGGKLVISGTTVPNTWVRLDGQPEPVFNRKAGADGTFEFGVLYHPGDCIVDIQRLVTPTKLGSLASALVANCGPAGVTPRGAWSRSAQYTINDLVTHEGSTWRARRLNANTEPVAGAVWEQFAAAGVPQPASEEGEAGDVQPPTVAPTGPAGGDLTGNYPNPLIGNLRVTTPKLANDAVTSAKILDLTIRGIDIALGTIGGGRLAPNAISSSRILDNSVASVDVLNNTLTAADLAPNSVGTSELLDETITDADLKTDSVGSSEIWDGAVTGAEVADFSLTNQDVGVLFAEVSGAGVVDNSSGGVSATRLQKGEFIVDFGRDVSHCTAVATLGSSDIFVTLGGTVDVADRSGNAEAVVAVVRGANWQAADYPFRLVVVC